MHAGYLMKTLPTDCHLLVKFCLSVEMNSGQDSSHSKCTLWTRCLGLANPSVIPLPHLGKTRLALARFSLYSFSFKMLCSVWQHMLLSLPGCEHRQIHLSLSQRVFAIVQCLVRRSKTEASAKNKLLLPIIQTLNFNLSSQQGYPSAQ